MLNYIFSGMIIVSLIYSFFNGTYVETINGGLNGVTDTVSLMLTLIAVMSFFNGMMKIAEKGGITNIISGWFEKILKPLFPEMTDKKTFGAMSMNITANLLGMGNAATPLGITAMENMKRISEDKSKATNSMCLFAIINTASIQLIPSTIIAIRMKYDSQMPYFIVVPIWISSVCGLMAGVISAKIAERQR